MIFDLACHRPSKVQYSVDILTIESILHDASSNRSRRISFNLQTELEVVSPHKDLGKGIGQSLRLRLFVED